MGLLPRRTSFLYPFALKHFYVLVSLTHLIHTAGFEFPTKCIIALHYTVSHQ